MSGIRGGGTPPPGPTDVGKKAAPADASKPEDTIAPAQRGADRATTERTEPLDSFDRGKVTAQLETKLQALAGRTSAGRVQFTNDELAYLASAFAAIVKQHSKASRLRRARMFTRAILKRRRLRKLFAGSAESDLEQMYDVIAEQLDGSPHFAQLVEEVTEGARKLNAR